MRELQFYNIQHNDYRYDSRNGIIYHATCNRHGILIIDTHHKRGTHTMRELQFYDDEPVEDVKKKYTPTHNRTTRAKSEERLREERIAASRVRTARQFEIGAEKRAASRAEQRASKSTSPNTPVGEDKLRSSAQSNFKTEPEPEVSHQDAMEKGWRALSFGLFG